MVGLYQGEFKIENIPAGEHTFVVWHEASRFLERRLKITITADKETKQDITYKQDSIKAGVDPNSKTFYVSTGK